MNTLILNDLTTTPFTLKSYNRSTTFDVENNYAMNSTAYFDIDSSAEVTAALQTIGQTAITSIEIQHDGDSIYSLTDLNAHISTINEYLQENNINISVSVTF